MEPNTHLQSEGKIVISVENNYRTINFEIKSNELRNSNS